MKSQDVVIMFKIISLQQHEDQGSFEYEALCSNYGDQFSVRGLEASLGISKTEINASINRSISTGLAFKDRESGRAKPNRRHLYNFVLHGLKYVFPAKPGAITRGLPTAFAAPMLKESLVSGGEEIYVWPHAEGQQKGQKVAPLFKSVPEAVNKDGRLYEYLALVDAVRLGRQREAGLAGEILDERLFRK